MFKSIQEGLEIYRRKLGEHFQEESRVAEREMKERGVDYRGIRDWPEEDRKAFNTKSDQLCGMATALGLSDQEIKSHWNDVERQLGLRR